MAPAQTRKSKALSTAEVGTINDKTTILSLSLAAEDDQHATAAEQDEHRNTAIDAAQHIVTLLGPKV